jgi:hypothetical protein
MAVYVILGTCNAHFAPLWNTKNNPSSSRFLSRPGARKVPPKHRCENQQRRAGRDGLRARVERASPECGRGRRDRASCENKTNSSRNAAGHNTPSCSMRSLFRERDYRNSPARLCKSTRGARHVAELAFIAGIAPQLRATERPQSPNASALPSQERAPRRLFSGVSLKFV